MQGQGSGTLMWSVAVHCVRRLWGFPGGSGQGILYLCFAWGHPSWAMKQSEMAATYAGLGDS